MAEEKKNVQEVKVVKKKSKAAQPKSETEKTLDIFGALFSQKNTPINFTVVKVSCVCGVPLNLHLKKPDCSVIAWGAFCKDCRRHIQFAIVEGPL